MADDRERSSDVTAKVVLALAAIAQWRLERQQRLVRGWSAISRHVHQAELRRSLKVYVGPVAAPPGIGVRAPSSLHLVWPGRAPGTRLPCRPAAKLS